MLNFDQRVCLSMFIDDNTGLSKSNVQKEKRVEFMYVLEEKTVTSYLMYISYIVNNETYFYTEVFINRNPVVSKYSIKNTIA